MSVIKGVRGNTSEYYVSSNEEFIYVWPCSDVMHNNFGSLFYAIMTDEKSRRKIIIGQKESRETLACLYRTSGRFYMLQLTSVDSRHFTEPELSLQ